MTHSRIIEADKNGLLQKPDREARAVSQTYAVALRRLAVAQALRSPDTLELSAAEYAARTNYQRAMRELNI